MTNSDYYAPIRALTETDAYKLGRSDQFPAGTEYLLNNWTNRFSRIERIQSVVHFGLQPFIQEWMTDAWESFWSASEDEVADLYAEFTTNVLGFPTGVEQIRELHHLGYLPIRFCAVPEGTLVPIKVPSFTMENTDPRFAWLVGYIETALSASYWLPSTSATQAFHLRNLFDEWALKTTGSTEGVDYQAHDFSFRGMQSISAAAASGAGHLLSFKGSDNLNAINLIEHNYFGQNPDILASVPATEHSVMVSGGSGPGEEESTYSRLLDLYPSGILSAVSDTWSLWTVLTEILPNLKSKIMTRDGKLVIRPDSGDPVDILTGDDPKENFHAGDETTPAQKGVVELLWEVFGGTTNEQGYKVLDPHIGVIYGDSLSFERAEEIFERLEAKGFASTNVVLGMGSYFYGGSVTRDTFSSAVKATWISINGEGRDIFKDPVTDSGMKKSAKGRLAVVRDAKSGELTLLDQEEGATAEHTEANLLKPIWEDGRPLEHQSFEQVREVLAAQRTY